MKLLVTFILISTIPSIILLDLTIKYENYNPKILYESLPGYGEKWMFFPDGNGVPRKAQLDITDGNASSRIFDPVKLVTDALTVKESDIKFHLYTRSNNKESQLLKIDNILTASNFDSKRPTKFITHGWTSSQESDTCQSIKNNYLEVEDANVIVIDWSTIASNMLYPVVAVATKQVGEYVAKMVDFLADNGLDVNKLHMIGHSLGAHVCGCAGSAIKKGKVARITGLDPALPGFEYISIVESRLDKSDAQFVDVIHTCGGVLGYFSDIGHVDFYPNGGVPCQPGCMNIPEKIEACSHNRAWQFYGESIQFPNAYLAHKCGSWMSFQKGYCNQGKTIPMGFSTPTTERGIYYLVADYSSWTPPVVAKKNVIDKIMNYSMGAISKLIKKKIITLFSRKSKRENNI